MTKIAFIGFGEAGYHIAKSLQNVPGVERVAFDPAVHTAGGDLIKQRASETGTQLLATFEDLFDDSDVIFSLVSASAVTKLASQSASLLQAGQIYADMNSAGPDTKAKAADLIAQSAGAYVDAAVMGTVPGLGLKVPMLASGSAAQSLADLLNPLGARIDVIDGSAGRASALKMLRSIFMKGVVALLLETVISGRAFGVEDDLLESIAETFEGKPFVPLVNDLMARGIIHAERRAHEMDEVIATLASVGRDDTMSRATRKKLEDIAAMDFKAYFAGKAPESYKEMFTLLEQHASPR